LISGQNIVIDYSFTSRAIGEELLNSSNSNSWTEEDKNFLETEIKEF
jgi:hypothetical protein